MFEQESEFELKEKLDNIEKRTEKIKKGKTIIVKTPTSESNTIEELFISSRCSKKDQVGGVTKEDFIEVYRRGYNPGPKFRDYMSDFWNRFAKGK